MPVKIWGHTSDGVLTNKVETSRSDSYRGERYRADAEALDEEVDRMLDQAATLAARVPAVEARQQSFVKRWSVGRALAESSLLESEYLETNERRWLWLAIARKCRLGVRSDGGSEPSWRKLIPNRESDPHRIERDVFAIGRWLQEQDIGPAMASFGASLTNAREIHRRGAINSKNLRDVLGRWFEDLSSARRSELTKSANFVSLAKTLARHFPARGPGSAKRPAHYSDEELYEEVCKVLDPIAADLAPESGGRTEQSSVLQGPRHTVRSPRLVGKLSRSGQERG